MVIQEIGLKHKDYPTALAQIHNAPTKLYALGKIPTMPMLTIIGTRRPTAYGLQITRQLAGECARAGFAIVSGLAIGLDTIAHQAALEVGGTTVAVMAHGLDHIHPASNRELAKRILASGGAIISEHPVGVPPQKHTFVTRNRIAAGLSEGIIVTEAQATSGTLITTNFGLAENRVIMAVPGNITSRVSAGPNNLIRSGAIPVTSSGDVLLALGYENSAAAQATTHYNEEEGGIIGLIGQGFNTTELILKQSAYTPAELASALSLMEISGKIRNLGAGQWAAS